MVPVKLQVKITEDVLEELLFFAETKFPLKTVEDFTAHKAVTYGLLFKRSNDQLAGNIDDVTLQMVYGNSRRPPGDERSPAYNLRKIWVDGGVCLEWKDVCQESDEALEKLEDRALLGIWAPPNALTKGMVFKHLFPQMSGPYKIPDPKDVPLHIAIAYDFYKAKDVFQMSEKYPGKVMNFGYFSGDVRGEAKLLAKTPEKFETRSNPTTYEEKLIIQLAKDDAQCVMDFIDIGPSYMSRDVEMGETDCKFFFPPGYNAPEAEIVTYLKKKTKRKAKNGKLRMYAEQLKDMDNQSGITGDIDTSITDFLGDDSGPEDGYDDVEEAERQNEDMESSMDKATSPVAGT